MTRTSTIAFATLFAISVGIAQSSSAATQQKAAKPAGREQIVVGLPKTYGKAESMNIWGAYFAHIGKCANVDVVNLRGDPVHRNLDVDLFGEKDLIEQFKQGKVQVAQLNPGLVPQLVGAGEQAPFAVPGKQANNERNSYKLILIVRGDSPYQKPTDLVGKKIAHTTPSSNSGNLAPRALFPGIGLNPEKNYEVVFSKGHERSIMGTMYGFWDGAAVASDLYARMLVKEEIKPNDFRVIWESRPFITESWAMSKSLKPELQTKIRECTYAYSFPDPMRKLLNGNDKFLPVEYERDFATVREVYDKTAALTAKK